MSTRRPSTHLSLRILDEVVAAENDMLLDLQFPGWHAVAGMLGNQWAGSES